MNFLLHTACRELARLVFHLHSSCTGMLDFSHRLKGNHMPQYDQSYEGFYARFDTVSKGEGSLLMGADNIVGDDFEVFFKTENGIVSAWVQNKFGAEVGYFDIDASRKLHLAHARDQKIRAILSFVAYSDTPDPGCYWGQMALFCYNPAYSSEIDAFIDRCANAIGEGVRPKIDLGSQAVAKIFEEENWMPSETMPLPQKETGMAVLKDHQSMSEKMIEQGRAKNKGCYVVSWAFIILVIVAIAYGLHMAGLF